MGELRQDLRFGLSRLKKAPGVTIVAALALGLAIGANSTIFSLLDAMFFRPLPVENPERLVRLYTSSISSPEGRSSFPDYEDYLSGISSFSGLLASGRRGALLRRGDTTETILVEVVSRNYFEVLGTPLSFGTAWGPGPGADEQDLVVISRDLWSRRFGSDPEIVGKPIHLSGENLVVGAVAAPRFRGLDRLIAVEAWIRSDTWARRMNSRSDFERRDSRWLDVWGRLAQDASVDQAQAEASVAAAGLARRYPETNQDRTSLVLAEAAERRRNGLGLTALLMSLAGLALLVCCANIANLLLAQFEARRPEIATRLALGAPRLRIIRQAFTESLLLAAIGGAAGLLLAWRLIDLLPAMMPQTWIRLNLDFTADGRVVAFSVFVALTTTILFGAAPALHAGRVDLMSVLRGQGVLGSEASSKMNLQNVLVAGQIAACVVLLTTSGLFIQSLRRGLELKPGFERKPMLLLSLSPGLAGYDREATRAFYTELRQRLGALPGVETASYAMRAPLSMTGGGASVKAFFDDEGMAIKYNSVGPRYFNVMGTRILRGRDFGSGDGREAPRVALVSATTARRFWPGRDPIGETIRIGDSDRTAHEIVGVVEDVKINSIHEEPQPYLYFPFDQRPRSEATFLIAASVEETALASPVRATLRAVAPDVAVLDLTSQEELMRYALYTERTYAGLASALGTLGLFLAGTGLFGVISYLIGLRTNEIGIRIALGAQSADVLRTFVGRGLWLSSVGVAVGLCACLALTRLLSGFLYGVSPRDPMSFLGAALVVMLTAAFASYLPARRAAAINPVSALRQE